MTTQVDTTIATMEMYKPVVFLDSLVPRPLPNFQCYTQRVTLKIWEWPGDEATYVRTYVPVSLVPQAPRSFQVKKAERGLGTRLRTGICDATCTISLSHAAHAQFHHPRCRCGTGIVISFKLSEFPSVSAWYLEETLHQ